MQNTIRQTLDKRLLFSTCLTYLIEGLSFTMCFPIIIEMLVHYNVPNWLHTPAEWLLLACFIPPQIASGYVHGAIADRFDKRLVVLATGTALCICTILQGLTNNFAIAVLLRMFSGVFNGNVSTAKEFMAKATQPSQRQFVYSFFGFAWGIGGLLGVAMGYQLSTKRLTDQPPLFLANNPFFVPFLVTSIVIMGVLLAYFTLVDQDPNTKRSDTWNEHFSVCWNDIKTSNLMVVSTPWQHYKMIQYVALFLLRTYFIGSYAKEDPVIH